MAQTLAAAADESGAQRFVIVLLGGALCHHEDIIAIGNAVEVDEQFVFHCRFVALAEAGGAEEAVFLIIEEHEGAFFPGFGR